jgi:hypothetical protein
MHSIAGGWKRNIDPSPGVASVSDTAGHAATPQDVMEGAMATTREHDQIVETPMEARQAEPGPSVLALLTASTGLAILILGVIWFVFFRV